MGLWTSGRERSEPLANMRTESQMVHVATMKTSNQIMRSALR